MIKKLLLAVIGLVLLVGMIVLALPARMVIDESRLPPALKLDGVSGRWWSGRAASVTWYGQPRGELRWHYGFPDSVTFTLDNGDSTVNSEIKLAPLLSGQQQAVFEEFSGQIQASELPVLLDGVQLHGELVFNLASLQAARNRQLNLDGNVIWHHARLSGQVALDLGQVDVHLNPHGDATMLDLTNNNSGDVLLTGNGLLAADNYQLRLHLRAGFGKDQLRRQLAQLGELNPDGSVTINLQGRY